MQAQEPPKFGGVRFGPALAGALYLLLVASAALALWVRSTPTPHPGKVAVIAPWVFLGFVAVFALYRFGLVRVGRYPAFKAFFQIAVGLLFFMLLLPGTRFQFAARDDGANPLAVLLRDSNPKVRALAAEVAGYRPDGAAAAPELARALTDPEEQVREQAHRSLVKISGGQDLGPASEPKAVEAWRERYP